MAYPTTSLNTMLNSLAASHAAVFNGDPQGAGTQIGARVAITLNTAASGSRTLSGVPEFTIPAGQTVTHVAYYTAITGGTLLVSKAVTNEVFAAEGTYRLTAGTLTLTNQA
jgi:hypothetical protein